MTQKNISPAKPVDDKDANAAAPSEKGTGHGDGLLDSLGKAVTAPVEGAAEPDEKALEKPGAKPAN